MDENLEKALEYFKNKEYEKAAEIFENILPQDPNNPNILNNLALCYQKNNEFTPWNLNRSIVYYSSLIREWKI